MSIVVRPSAERGHANHGWLDSHHTFSFGEYRDPAHTGFGPLRVINEDRVAPGGGFAPHGHRDMEIISYVLKGALEHKDSLGSGSVIRPGDVQVMSAGTGVRHSEYNASEAEPVHFLQIWVMPDGAGHAPRYDERRFDAAGRENRLRLIVSGEGRDGSLAIHQNADIYETRLDAGKGVELPLSPGRRAWVQVVSGSLRVGDTLLTAGDACAVEGETHLGMVAESAGAQALLFDLP